MHKREPRYPSTASVWLYRDELAQKVDVVNVSSGGACLRGTGKLPVGAEVTIRYRHLIRRVRVQWSGKNLWGVRFLNPLTSAQIQVLTDAARDSAADSERAIEEAFGSPPRLGPLGADP